jgi:hypothetical protein
VIVWSLKPGTISRRLEADVIPIAKAITPARVPGQVFQFKLMLVIAKSKQPFK